MSYPAISRRLILNEAAVRHEHHCQMTTQTIIFTINHGDQAIDANNLRSVLALGQTCLTNSLAMVSPCRRIVMRHYIDGLSG